MASVKLSLNLYGASTKLFCVTLLSLRPLPFNLCSVFAVTKLSMAFLR